MATLSLSRQTYIIIIYPERNLERRGSGPGRFLFSPVCFSSLAGTVSARWHVARGALLPECRRRRRRCIFCGDGRTVFARARPSAVRAAVATRARTHARTHHTGLFGNRGGGGGGGGG